MGQNLVGILATFAFAATLSVSEAKPITAQVENGLEGKGFDRAESAIAEMQGRSGELFLSDSHAAMLITIRYGTLSHEILGQARRAPFTCDIVINDWIAPEQGIWSPKDFELVLMHEMGHCFGLPHTEDPDDLMYYAFKSNRKREEVVQAYMAHLAQVRSSIWLNIWTAK